MRGAVLTSVILLSATVGGPTLAADAPAAAAASAPAAPAAPAAHASPASQTSPGSQTSSGSQTSLASQASQASPQGRSWSSIAKLPDWSGVWDLDYQSGRGGGLVRPAPPHMTPEYAAKYAAYQDAQKKGLAQQTETANCVPPGMPQIMAQPYPIEFLFTPGKVTVAIEAYSQMRRIYTDGRKHPDDPDPSFGGHSIGHWEGDTLVVDSIAFIPTSQIAPGVGHSDDMRIVERIHRLPDDVMEIQQTITDPKVLTEPYVSLHYYKRHKDWDINEYICTQNNRDSADSEGRAGLKIER